MWMKFTGSDRIGTDKIGDNKPVRCVIMIRNIGHRKIEIDQSGTHRFRKQQRPSWKFSSPSLFVALRRWELHTVRGTVRNPHVESGKTKRERASDLSSDKTAAYYLTHPPRVSDSSVPIPDSGKVSLGHRDWAVVSSSYHVPGCLWIVEAVKKTEFVRANLILDSEPMNIDLKVDQTKVQKFYSEFRPGLLLVDIKGGRGQYVYNSNCNSKKNVEIRYDRDEKYKKSICLGLVQVDSSDGRNSGSDPHFWFHFTSFDMTLEFFKRALSLEAQSCAKVKSGEYGQDFRYRLKDGESLDVKCVYFVDEDEVTGARSLRKMSSDEDMKQLRDGMLIRIVWADEDVEDASSVD
jgi:hypothetical protein